MVVSVCQTLAYWESWYNNCYIVQLLYCTEDIHMYIFQTQSDAARRTQSGTAMTRYKQYMLNAQISILRSIVDLHEHSDL